MEYITEYAIVYLVLIYEIRLIQFFYILIVKTRFASHICIDESRGYLPMLIQFIPYCLCLIYFFILIATRSLPQFKRVTVYCILSFYHQLQHKATHFACLPFFCSIIIGKCQMLATLYHAIKIICRDGYLIVNGSQSISFSYRIRDKRSIVDTLRPLSFIT